MDASDGKLKIIRKLNADLIILFMATRRKKPTAPLPRKPETASELAPLLQALAVKQLDRGTGEAADWPMIAEAAALVMFAALDKLPDDPRTMRVLKKLGGGVHSRLAPHDAVEPETFQADNRRTAAQSFGGAAPSHDLAGPDRPR